MPLLPPSPPPSPPPSFNSSYLPRKPAGTSPSTNTCAPCAPPTPFPQRACTTTFPTAFVAPVAPHSHPSTATTSSPHLQCTRGFSPCQPFFWMTVHPTARRKGEVVRAPPLLPPPPPPPPPPPLLLFPRPCLLWLGRGGVVGPSPRSKQLHASRPCRPVPPLGFSVSPLLH